MKFKESLNLMNLKGAQILNVTSPDGKNLGSCICIPAAYNDMLRTKEDGSVVVAPYLNIRAWEARKEYVDACVRNHAGDDKYVPPTHILQLSFSQEFEKKAVAAAAKRLRAEHPDWSDDDVNRQAGYACRINLGDMTPIGEDAQRIYTPSQQASATATPVGTDPIGEAMPEDDLPF